MDATDGELAARVSELAQICARLSRENAELRQEMTRLSEARAGAAARPAANGASGTRGRPGLAASPARPVSRRMIGKAVGAAAVSAAGAAALVDLGARPAAAANGSNVTAGNVTKAERRTAVQYDGSAGFGGIVLFGNDSGYDGGSAAFPAGVGGWAGAGANAGAGGVQNGVYGYTEHGPGHGVVGVNNNDVPGGGAGVRGISHATGGSGSGVWGSHDGGGAGVQGSAAGDGAGVVGTAGNGIGVLGSGRTGVSASGGGIGLAAVGPIAIQALPLPASGQAIVAGNSSDNKATIKATNGGKDSGIHATSKGRGGVFGGNAAQIQLTPGTGATHPRSGSRGDLYADKNGRLWFCKKGGTTATWHQIA
jgi:hypothetical protein